MVTEKNNKVLNYKKNTVYSPISPLEGLFAFWAHTHSVNPGISPLELILFFGFLHWGLFEGGGLKNFPCRWSYSS